jgi:hypothetical protein
VQIIRVDYVERCSCTSPECSHASLGVLPADGSCPLLGEYEVPLRRGGWAVFCWGCASWAGGAGVADDTRRDDVRMRELDVDWVGDDIN